MVPSSSVRVAALVAAGLATTTPAFADAASDFYKGKTVTYIVATNPGGGADFFGRLTTRHMQRVLPDTTFIVKNMPGAGHIIGANYLYASKPDGLTIGSFTTGLTYAQIMGQSGVKFDLTRMSWIGKSQTDIRVLYMSGTSPFKSFQEIMEAKRPVSLGTSGIGTGAYTESHMVARAFKFPVKILTGYGGSEAAMGMMRGELDGQMGGLTSTMDVLRIDKGRIVLQFGKVLPDVPNAEDLVDTDFGRQIVRFMKNQALISRFVAGPPEIPADRLEFLRTTYKKAFEGEEIRNDLRNSDDGALDLLYGDDVAKLVKETVQVSPELVELLKQTMKE